jgi:hypothetical protein
LRVLPPPAARFAALAVGVAALYATAEIYQAAAMANRQNRDPYLAGMQDARFAALAAVVKPSAKLGYISDLPAESAAGQAMYFTAQYALAPRLLVRAEYTDAAQLVGNFSRPPDLAKMGFALERDFGNGVMLLGRAK